jgi:type IV pilus assembly protein PilV
MTGRRLQRARARGYTVVELMMALTILAIGVSGIIAMEKVTVAANQHAKSLAIASRIAEAWQEQLAADAAQWNHPSEKQNKRDLDSDTTWLKLVDSNPGQWVRPQWSAARQFGAAFDALGNPISEGGASGSGASANLSQAVFCANIRLDWLYPDTAGNGLIRASVRVFWVRDGMGGTVNGQSVCDPSANPTDIGQAVTRYHFVYQTTAVKQQTAI